MAAQVLCWSLEGVTIDELPAGVVNGTFENDYDPAGYAMISTPTVTVTADNYQDTVIAQELYTQEQIDQSVAQIKAAVGN